MNLSDAEKRIAELEEALRRQQEVSARYKEDLYALVGEVFPYEPITDEEAQRLMTETSGRPILEIVEELERKVGDGR